MQFRDELAKFHKNVTELFRNIKKIMKKSTYDPMLIILKQILLNSKNCRCFGGGGGSCSGSSWRIILGIYRINWTLSGQLLS